MTNKFIILLVEDNPGDARLISESLNNGKVFHELHIVSDGLEALDFLYYRSPYTDAPQPDLILLDLNLPQMDGRELLMEIKKDPYLARIPVIFLTSSQAEEDILKAYDLHANSYIIKPVGLEQFIATINTVKEFWMSIALVPPKESR